MAAGAMLRGMDNTSVTTFSPSAGDVALPSLLATRDDLPDLAERFARNGRLQIDNILAPEFCEALSARIASWPTWALVTIVNGQHRNFDAAQMRGIDPVARARFDDMVSIAARDSFQYLYERFPLFDPGVEGVVEDDVLRTAAALLQGEAFLGLTRAITGLDGIRCADGQLSRYRRGHFLTLHDDHADGKHRLAAYVLSLTPHWPADFGGQLQFLSADGGVEAVLLPRYNTLNIFSVPAPHLVSAVAPFVDVSRISITGWLRSG